MGIRLTTDADLTSVANAIRTKGGTNASLSYPTGFVSAIGAISTGGSSVSTDGQIKFIDYDGTLIATKTKAEINAMTSDSDLPENPSHTGLIAQGWNWTVAQLKAQLTAMPDDPIYVGQLYTTTSGASEIDVEMEEGRLSPVLTIAVNGTITVDWGDGTTPDTVTGSSLITRIDPTHTYASAGKYTIKISETTGSEYSFYCSSSYLLLRKDTTANPSQVYSNCVKNIRFGSGIKTIASYAFYYCTSLKSITIPSGVTSIGSTAFSYCYSLKSITIPSSVTSIGGSAFSYCYSLASIIIPSGVTSIGSTAFSYCASLKNITIPSSVTSIGGSAFYNCYSLASIIIPSEVTSIGNNVFYNCTSLESVVIPSSVTSIGKSAFSGCYSLKSITIQNSETSIGGSAFYNCYSLASIIIPSEVTSIADSSFQNCNSLARVEIPNDVTSIGSNVFSNCFGVAEYHLLPTTPPTLANTNAFANIPSDCVIYVPYSADHSIINTYKSASNWSTYADYVQEEPQS